MAKRRACILLSIGTTALTCLEGCVGRLEDWTEFRDCSHGRCEAGGANPGGAHSTARTSERASAGTAWGAGSSSELDGQWTFGGHSAGGASSALAGSSAGASSALAGSSAGGASFAFGSSALGASSALGGTSTGGASFAFGGTSAGGASFAFGGSSIPVEHSGSAGSSNVAIPPPTFEPASPEHRNTLALGRQFSCGIRNGKLGCWGANDVLQLGKAVGWPEDSVLPLEVDLRGIPDDFVPVEVEAGFSHACARSDAGTVVCWGAGQPSGQNANFTLPARILFTEEDTIGEPLELTAGVAHSCAKWRSGWEVWCWGSNYDNELGWSPATGPSNQDSLTPVLVGLAWQENGALQLSSGWSHTCALREDLSVWCWGENDRFQLGHESQADPTQLEKVSFPTQAGPIIQVNSGNRHVCARDRLGQVFCWGDNSYGQLNPAPGAAQSWAQPQLIALPAPSIDVGAGWQHSCALLTDGSVWCWGGNHEGCLGAAVASPSGPVQVRFAGNPKIVELAVGETHSCVRRQEGGVHCWGGTESARGGTTLEIARQLP